MGVGHIFPDYVLSHFAAGVQCGRVDCDSEALEVFMPMVRRRHPYIELVYPCRCSCGRRGSFVIGMRMIALGHLLARVALFRAENRRRKTSLTIQPGGSDLVRRFLDDFDDEMQKHVEYDWARHPNEADRQKFGLTEPAWRDFLRRLGFDAESGPPF